MKKRVLSFIFAICLIIPCMFFLSACNDESDPGNKNHGTHTHIYTDDKDSTCNTCGYVRVAPRTTLTLQNYEKYIHVSPNLTTASSGYNLIYDFAGVDGYRYESVVITYQLYYYNVLISNPKILYDDQVDSYSVSLTLDGTGATFKVDVPFDWRIEILSITGDAVLKNQPAKAENTVTLTMDNYSQYLTFTQVAVANKNETGVMYWNIKGLNDCVYNNVTITYNYFDYDFYENEVEYDYYELGIETPYSCKLDMNGQASTLYIFEDYQNIKIISISGTVSIL